MADPVTHKGFQLSKNSKIVVNVEEALHDILVVTYALENKLYQGVLLDSSKRLLPCGILPPTDTLNKKTGKSEDDVLYSISQRFTYFQEKSKTAAGSLPQVNSSVTKPKLKPTRMTVRLRPRQVLCSKCKSICNENSENVEHSAEAKQNSPCKENENQNSYEKPCRNLRNLHPTLIPKLSRLQPNEITNAINGKVVTRANVKSSLLQVDNTVWLGADTQTSHSGLLEAPKRIQVVKSPLEEQFKDDYIGEEEDVEEKMVLRKKRSVGSMEDLWDENVFVEATKKARTTPVIKISFGSQGEGTVLEIPAKVQNCSESEPEEKHKSISAKAAKKALKKAKKEARRKLGQGASPGASPVYEALHYRRHRHKVKHKKKHKEDRLKDSPVFSEIKERCLKQKLSISLRRLNANSYAARSESGCSELSWSSSSCDDALPDFPPLENPHCSPPAQEGVLVTPQCSKYAVGDIVWGKIQGFPWWPGKVVKLCCNGDQAQVTWYGSSTSSLVLCHQLSPFLESFKSRFNKKKKSGSYKEAIRQATSEASDIPQKIVSPLRSLVSSPTPVHVN